MSLVRKCAPIVVVMAFLILCVKCNHSDQKTPATAQPVPAAVPAEAPQVSSSVIIVRVNPSWTNSPSAWERLWSKELIAVGNDSYGWKIRARNTSGDWGTFFVNDTTYPSIEAVRNVFDINIEWATKKAVYDALNQ